MSNFANILKNLRMDHHLTQIDLARALGISRSTVSMYECGEREPDIDSLKKIAEYFHVDMNFLLGENVGKKNADGVYEPSYEDIQSLLARNGKKLTIEQKQQLIRVLLSD